VLACGADTIAPGPLGNPRARRGSIAGDCGRKYRPAGNVGAVRGAAARAVREVALGINPHRCTAAKRRCSLPTVIRISF
jgi:hypothetical protein